MPQQQDESYTLEDDYGYEDEEGENEETQEEDEEEVDEEDDYFQTQEPITNSKSHPILNETRSEIFSSFHEYLTPECVSTNTTSNTNTNANEKRTTKNKDKCVSASTSMSYLNSDAMSKNLFFNKTIGDIQFPNNLDVLGSIKTSASKYLLELSNEKSHNDTVEDDGEHENENASVSAANISSQNKADTFVSCNDEDVTNYFGASQNASNATNATKSSINDLQITFDNYGSFFKYCDLTKAWVHVGKCNMQIIVDEMTVKGRGKCCFIFSAKNVFKRRDTGNPVFGDD